MKQIMIWAVLLGALLPAAGCSSTPNGYPGAPGCTQCAAPAPVGGHYAYPYYTVRGPRDFLQDF